MNVLIAATMALFSVLVPSKIWYVPTGPVEISVKAAEPVELVLADFSGKNLDPQAPNEIANQQTVDVKTIFPQIQQPGSYVLLLPQAISPRPGIRTTVGLGSRMDGESGCLQDS